ncbi:hypothetical protein NMY3_00433 [Candidatus Nitrosocosmicus oleophilus]|uniref:Uncharacterized protein n=1 Tax=Candidatus Nitrosocosmicus oleophilus TaxID=1353260 RepID=A0A654LW27_9ARCH|nr:hypothetical protein NMY3_00433 [Candidatus Nitrosocosmicus oleophilus]
MLTQRVNATSEDNVFDNVSVLFKSVRVTFVFTLVSAGSPKEVANWIIPHQLL